MKNVLVPTDFSPASLHAVRTGAELVRRSGGMLHLLHNYQKPLSGIALQIEVDNAALRNLKDGIDEAFLGIEQMDCMDGIEVQSHIVADEVVWDSINEDIFKDVELIIVGATGSTSHKSVPAGSVARKVVQFASKPVMVVKGEMDLDAIKNIVFASNFYGESSTAFKPISRFAKMIGAKLHLLKIITPAQFERTEYTLKLMEDFAENNGVRDHVDHVYNDITIERGIQSFCKTHGADLVAMETHGRTGLSHLFYGSTTEDVLQNLDLPLFSTHINPEKNETHEIH